MKVLESLLFMLNQMSPYILLGFLIAGLIYAFVPQKMMSRHLAGTGFGSVFKAALFGVPLPLCSCGVLPTAIGLRRSGASRAASTSFLIATPQTGVDSIAATWSLLGPAFAVIRPVAAFVTSIFGGMLVGHKEKNSAENLTAEFINKCTDNCCAGNHEHGEHNHDHHNGVDTLGYNDKPTDLNKSIQGESVEKLSFGGKCVAALRYGFIDLVGSIGGWLVIGLVVAALITVFVPADAFAVLGDHPLPAMFAVLIVAVPMYICATGSIPIAMSLMLKGLSPGAALVMLMAGPAANFASFALIRREMGNRTAWLYLLAISAGAILFGLGIDYLLPRGWFDLKSMHGACHTDGGMGIFNTICSGILVVLLAVTFVKNRRHKHITPTEMTKTYKVKGMNCPHCQATVTRAISGVDGVSSVDVNLSNGLATVEGEASSEAIAVAVRAAGFDMEV